MFANRFFLLEISTHLNLLIATKDYRYFFMGKFLENFLDFFFNSRVDLNFHFIGRFYFDLIRQIQFFDFPFYQPLCFFSLLHRILSNSRSLQLFYLDRVLLLSFGVGLTRLLTFVGFGSLKRPRIGHPAFKQFSKHRY